MLTATVQLFGQKQDPVMQAFSDLFPDDVPVTLAPNTPPILLGHVPTLDECRKRSVPLLRQLRDRINRGLLTGYLVTVRDNASGKVWHETRGQLAPT